MIRIEEFLKAGLHLGHKKQRTNPKAKKYIYDYEKGIAIFDLYKTEKQIDTALDFLTNLKKQKKTLIVVATKKTISDSITKQVLDKNIPYLTSKWVGGFLTNFSSIKKNIDYVNDLIKQKQQEDWEKLIKHERMLLEKKLNKMLLVYRGVLNISKIPDALYVVDIKKEKNAIIEARKLGVKIVAVCDSNTNPDLVDYPICANDDALSSVEYITNLVVKAYAEPKNNNNDIKKVESKTSISSKSKEQDAKIQSKIQS